MYPGVCVCLGALRLEKTGQKLRASIALPQRVGNVMFNMPCLAAKKRGGGETDPTGVLYPMGRARGCRC